MIEFFTVAENIKTEFETEIDDYSDVKKQLITTTQHFSFNNVRKTFVLLTNISIPKLINRKNFEFKLNTVW